MSASKTIRDAAILLQSLPDEVVSEVMSRIDGDCREQLSDRLSSQPEVSGRELHRITRRFREDVFGKHVKPDEQSPPEQKDDPLIWRTDQASVAESPFGFLKYLDSEPRRHLLESEHPLNVAMVLATLPPEFASRMTRELDPPFRLSVIRRLCDLDDIDSSRLMQLRYALRMRAKRMVAIENCTRRGIGIAANLLSLADQRTRDSVVAWLNDRDHELATALEQQIFTLADLLEFSDDQIRRLMRKVDTSAWAGALRSTIPSVAQRVMSCMAPRAANIVAAEISAFDPLDEQAMQWSIEKVVAEAIRIKAEEP